jgi:hypothetical protein
MGSDEGRRETAETPRKVGEVARIESRQSAALQSAAAGLKAVVEALALPFEESRKTSYR